METFVVILITFCTGAIIGYRVHVAIIMPEILKLLKCKAELARLQKVSTGFSSSRSSSGSGAVIEMEQQADGSYAVKR